MTRLSLAAKYGGGCIEQPMGEDRRSGVFGRLSRRRALQRRIGRVLFRSPLLFRLSRFAVTALLAFGHLVTPFGFGSGWTLSAGDCRPARVKGERATAECQGPVTSANRSASELEHRQLSVAPSSDWTARYVVDGDGSAAAPPSRAPRRTQSASVLTDRAG